MDVLDADRAQQQIEDIEEELEYLRYFYEEVQEALGPASDDVVELIGERYKQENRVQLPEGYE